eukprot:NODE_5866_length_1727_cov_3.427500.p1 GENE.NODE_5866_length_1727_cov_3.427500~~NODE_5866_length_1727_cov_3.427500.p1  ORF type:complete len:265 (+),score=76.73 NODE_5866_length_1727_cov_3.427500:119-913(+)
MLALNKSQADATVLPSAHGEICRAQQAHGAETPRAGSLHVDFEALEVRCRHVCELAAVVAELRRKHEASEEDRVEQVCEERRQAVLLNDSALRLEAELANRECQEVTARVEFHSLVSEAERLTSVVDSLQAASRTRAAECARAEAATLVPIQRALDAARAEEAQLRTSAVNIQCTMQRAAVAAAAELRCLSRSFEALKKLQRNVAAPPPEEGRALTELVERASAARNVNRAAEAKLVRVARARSLVRGLPMAAALFASYWWAGV